MCLPTKGQASLCLFFFGWLLLGTNGDCIRLYFNTINIRTGIYFPDLVSFRNINSISYSVTLKLYLSFWVNLKECDLDLKLMTQLLVESRWMTSLCLGSEVKCREILWFHSLPKFRTNIFKSSIKAKCLLFFHISLHANVIKQNHLRFDFLIFTLKVRDQRHLLSTKWFVLGLVF